MSAVQQAPVSVAVWAPPHAEWGTAQTGWQSEGSLAVKQSAETRGPTSVSPSQTSHLAKALTEPASEGLHATTGPPGVLLVVGIQPVAVQPLRTFVAPWSAEKLRRERAWGMYVP